jgi:hypothetical protein
MTTTPDLQSFMDKVKKMEKGEQLDLSSDEDLSIAIMNLISIEEHLFFTANKTGKSHYLDLLHQAREMRKELLKLIIKDYEGEVWCTSKHLLAASMRLFEVGTKAQTKGDKSGAASFFKKSYDLYNLFWALNLKLFTPSTLPQSTPKTTLTIGDKKETPLDLKKPDFMGKVSGVIGKILDCCRE